MSNVHVPQIMSAQFKANPYPTYARLRAEAPVAHIQIFSNLSAWLVTRYDDVQMLLKHPDFRKDRNAYMDPAQLAKMPKFVKLFEPLMNNMLNRDPPDHTRLRGLVHKAFTPRLVERLRPRIQAITDTLLEKAQRKGSMDLVREFALPLPSTIIAEMLGVPESDYGKFQSWSNRLVSNATALDALLAIPSVLMFTRYIRKLIERRRADPKDDLVSALIQAEEAGEKLRADELVSMVFLLLVAGHETTVNLIASGALALTQHPEQLERLRKEPALIESAVEELLRFTSPVDIATERFTSQDITVAGTTIPKGSQVFAVIGSANRDEQHFKDPDKLDLGREPNKHLSFGFGIHYCLGAPLARLEGQIALQTLVNRMPRLRVTKPAEELRWRKGAILRGLRSLPVAV